MTSSLYGRLAERLAAARAQDGGFGPRPGLPSEPEPTALATIALGDDAGRSWLTSHQRADGSLAVELAEVDNDSATAPAAIALGPGEARERAMDYLAAAMARTVGRNPVIPVDPAFPGWPWTRGTAGWVEPTARALLAFRLLRPDARGPIGAALGLLRDRECVGGGWNYGNRVVFGVDIPPYAETTAMALIGAQGADRALAERGLACLRRLWRDERDGGLTLSTTVAALALLDDPDREEAASALAGNFARTGFLGDTVSLAWGVIATGPALERLRVPG